MFFSFLATTVIARLIYVLDPYNSGKITLNDLRRFDQRQKIYADSLVANLRLHEPADLDALPVVPTSLADVWKSLDDSSDLNEERLFFSYEHFYVIYCTFWELDSNHDFQLDKQDLLKWVL